MIKIITVQEAAAALAIIADADTDYHFEIGRYANDAQKTNDEAESGCIVFEVFYNSGGFDAILYDQLLCA